MDKTLEKLRWERRRKLQVRQSFEPALAHFRSGGDPVPFYLAWARYMVPAQQRLIDQDMRLAELLASRVPPRQAQDRAAIEALRGRLQDSQRSLERFSAAAERLSREQSAARAGFEAAAAEYLDFLVNVLGARSHSLRHLTTTLLTEADWAAIADIDDAFIASEAELFEAVRAQAPTGADPAQMSVERPAAGKP